jgi:hypothetical protein
MSSSPPAPSHFATSSGCLVHPADQSAKSPPMPIQTPPSITVHTQTPPPVTVHTQTPPSIPTHTSPPSSTLAAIPRKFVATFGTPKSPQVQCSLLLYRSTGWSTDSFHDAFLRVQLCICVCVCLCVMRMCMHVVCLDIVHADFDTCARSRRTSLNLRCLRISTQAYHHVRHFQVFVAGWR